MGMAVLWLIFLFAGRPASAQSSAPQPAADKQSEKIHIVADLLTSDSETRFAEFIGNVRATQGNTVITSDRLKIFYSENPEGAKDPSTAQSAIKKIVASGNVTISFDDRVATAREAVYDTQQNTLVLSGSPSTVKSGLDSIMGEKITYNRTDGRITVEKGQNSRVEAVFHSKEGGLQ
jgi:lipopolysaccharide export system protein LptA